MWGLGVGWQSVVASWRWISAAQTSEYCSSVLRTREKRTWRARSTPYPTSLWPAPAIRYQRNVHDTLTKSRRQKPVPVPDASDMQFRTEFFWCQYLVTNGKWSIFVPRFVLSSSPRQLVTWQRTVSSSPTSALADFDQQTQRPVSRAPHVQQLRRPMLRSCRSAAMQLAANQSKTVSQSGTIQAFVKDIPV